MPNVTAPLSLDTIIRRGLSIRMKAPHPQAGLVYWASKPKTFECSNVTIGAPEISAGFLLENPELWEDTGERWYRLVAKNSMGTHCYTYRLLTPEGIQKIVDENREFAARIRADVTYWFEEGGDLPLAEILAENVRILSDSGRHDYQKNYVQEDPGTFPTSKTWS